jgi:hypothetical protein
MKTPKILNENQNAAASGGSGAFGIILVWLLSNWIEVPPEVAAAIPVALSTTVLYIGKLRKP